MPYDRDRKWSDKMTPQVIKIVGPMLLKQAPIELDNQQATDLIVLLARDIRIAARIRTYGYFKSFPFDFTIRAMRESGAETELSKIMKGFGDWFFYGHADKEDIIWRWHLISLDAFRAAMRSPSPPGGKQMNNYDGTHFMAFDLRTFPPQPPILIATTLTTADLVPSKPVTPIEISPRTKRDRQWFLDHLMWLDAQGSVTGAPPGFRLSRNEE